MQKYVFIENNVVNGTVRTAGEVPLEGIAVPDYVDFGWIQDPETGEFSEPEEPAPEIRTKITRIKFKQRMTQAERIAIRAAGDTDPNVYDFMDLLSEATYIDVSLPETIGGVNYLEAQGLLSVGRADIILNTPITETEAYKI